MDGAGRGLDSALDASADVEADAADGDVADADTGEDAQADAQPDALDDTNADAGADAAGDVPVEDADGGADAQLDAQADAESDAQTGDAQTGDVPADAPDAPACDLLCEPVPYDQCDGSVALVTGTPRECAIVEGEEACVLVLDGVADCAESGLVCAQGACMPVFSDVVASPGYGSDNHSIAPRAIPLPEGVELAQITGSAQFGILLDTEGTVRTLQFAFGSGTPIFIEAGRDAVE